MGAFISLMEMHLGITQRERRIGRRHPSIYTSMSPILEWTIHVTKKKSVENIADADADADAGERTCLVIFNIRKLRAMQDVAIFRISDVVRYLESQKQLQLIDPHLQEWAENCDEYLTMGSAVENAVIRVIPWSHLYSMPIINELFIRTYTLRKYREWKDQGYYPLCDEEEVSNIVVTSAMVLAGHDAQNAWMVPQMVNLILKPEVSFWGINTNASGTAVEDACKMAISQQELVQNLARTSVD